MDREGVVPDILLSGKALGGGVVPVSAMIASSAAYEKLNQSPLLHTSTFSGNPLGASAVRATIEVMRSENVPAKAHALGEILLARFATLRTRHSRLLRDVRARGILMGFEFRADYLAGDFMGELLSKNVIVSYSLNAHRVVRLTPPAFLSDADVAWLVDAVEESMRILDQRYPNIIEES